MKVSRILVIGGALVVVAALLLTLSFTHRSQADAVKTHVRPVAVEVTPAALTTVAEQVSAVGNAAALRDVIVSSETSGRVTAVAVQVGDVVRKGQVLVTVDAELKEVAVEQAQAQALAARTNLEKARKDFERTEKLFAAGDVADVELEAYRLAFHAAEAQEKAASAGLRFAERQLADTRITSPIAGRVATRLVEVGEMVSPGREVANIVDISSVKVLLTIPEEDVVKLRVGQHATLIIDSRPGERVQGTVSAISAKSATPNGHSYPVEVLAPNAPGDPLKVGMFIRVTIHAASVHDVVAVSKEALVDAEGSAAVFVADNGIARRRPVSTGLEGNGLVEIVRGLNAGDLVVTFGQRSLKEGTPLQFNAQ